MVRFLGSGRSHAVLAILMILVAGCATGHAAPAGQPRSRWNGRAWLAEPAPSHGHHSQLDDVSCAAAASCLAVGAPAEA